jgi:hypothetical protein
MPVRLRQNDVFLIPVTDGLPAVGHVILKMQAGNIFTAVYSSQSEFVESVEPAWLSSARPDFTVETMGLFIKNGTWPVMGKWNPPVRPRIPVCKTQFEFDGSFFEQYIDGNIGGQLTDDASRLRR